MELRAVPHHRMYGECTSYYSCVEARPPAQRDRREPQRAIPPLPGLRWRTAAPARRPGRKAFGDLPAEQLETDYDDYDRRLYLKGWSTPFAYSESTPPRVRPLLPREAHLLWLNLLP